ncbi:hypothetical protein GLOIN_2v1769705 [Rhizophagus clarus]|uniref:CCHC-type domain-containing protein n=1 Tax=Rhizophagus clarus TaxID=94130 RepID=A0A8H3KX26_9GLOM|nr:hypothetical protein GLOIN_2v1769705 [Rhizophagus clarus]
MNAAKENHFAFNNKGLYFTDKNALTCHVCGSINHKVRNCPENSQLKCCYDQQTAYQDIYKRYKVEPPKPKSGFKPIFPSTKDDFISSNMNWADNWNAEFSAKPTLPVRQNKTGFNPKSNHVFSKDIPSNIPQSQSIKLKKVKQQLNKFNALMKKFNDRIVNLEMHMLNQSYNKPVLDLNFSPVTDSFVNAFNKRVRTDEDMSDIARTSNFQLSNLPIQINTLSLDINMQNSQDELTTSQDFYHDAMEHNQNYSPTYG